MSAAVGSETLCHQSSTRWYGSNLGTGCGIRKGVLQERTDRITLQIFGCETLVAGMLD